MPAASVSAYVAAASVWAAVVVSAAGAVVSLGALPEHAVSERAMAELKRMPVNLFIMFPPFL